MLEAVICLLLPISILAVALATMSFVSTRRLRKSLGGDLALLQERIAAMERGGGGRVASSVADATTAAPPGPQASAAEGQIPAAAPPSLAAPPVAASETAPDRPPLLDITPAPAPQPQPVQTSPSGPPTVAPVPAATQEDGFLATMAESVQQNPVMRWFLGSHVVVRVGVVVLFFGVAFLLKYAADQGWLSIELRLTGAGLLGMALVYGGWYVRERQRMYALTLQGAGLGIAYLTVYVAFRVYGLLPAGLSFAVLVGIGVICVGLALVNNARSLAILAITGGFAAPLLVSTGDGNHVTLFLYFTILNAAILGIAWFKAWRELNVIGFVFTFLLASLWGAEYYRPDYYWSVEPFLILFFLFYVAIGLLFARRQPPQLAGVVDGPLVFGTPLVAALWQSRLVMDMEYGLAWTAGAIGLFYLVLAAVLFRGPYLNYRNLRESYLALGAVFATLAIPFAFDNRVTAAVWAVEGAGLVWLGLRQSRRFHTVWGLLIQLGAGIFFAVYWIDASLLAGRNDEAGLAVLNAFAMGGMLLAAAGLTTGYLCLHHSRIGRRLLIRGDLHLIQIGVTLWGVGWWYITGSGEIVRFAPTQSAMMQLVVLFFAVSAAGSEWLGGRFTWWTVRLPALLLWLPIGLAAPVSAQAFGPLLAGWGWLAWPGAVAVFTWMLYRLDTESRFRFYHAIYLWLFAWLGMLELTARVLSWELDSIIWTEIAVVLFPTLLVLTLPLAGPRQSGPWLVWPVRRHYGYYMKLCLAPLVGILVLWTVAVNFTNAGDSAPLPYWALVNPLSVTQILVFAAAFVWLGHLREAGITRRSVRGMRVAGFVLIFLWINGELARWAHQQWGISFEIGALLDSPLLQAVYSIIWALLALGLMVAGTRRGARWMWLLGVTILGLTVLKLFFVDLSRADTLARIVSFIVVGLLMLLIGYVAPIPPLAVENGAGEAPIKPGAAATGEEPEGEPATTGGAPDDTA